MTVTHDALLNHIMLCSFCNGRHDKYCKEGRGLWVDNHADYVIHRESELNRRVTEKQIMHAFGTWARIIENRVNELCETRKIERV